ncbi:hypothetical protein SS50377_25538 [Spironucleus salmonicida]|uniref:Uncharacterized protein n=1 Tax=Spironucleus salmonicida TaxID=348837 RepID=V6LN01_9EUKA|nr:hypothetical protein SS50377_25538 [Spironucleus salmonicida]|eukprot:EST45086.1 hypothetical protein SS50377_15106 [Spironucleus salmonicida]
MYQQVNSDQYKLTQRLTPHVVDDELYELSRQISRRTRNYGILHTINLVQPTQRDLYELAYAFQQTLQLLDDIEPLNKQNLDIQKGKAQKFENSAMKYKKECFSLQCRIEELSKQLQKQQSSAKELSRSSSSSIKKAQHNEDVAQMRLKQKQKELDRVKNLSQKYVFGEKQVTDTYKWVDSARIPVQPTSQYYDDIKQSLQPERAHLQRESTKDDLIAESLNSMENDYDDVCIEQQQSFRALQDDQYIKSNGNNQIYQQKVQPQQQYQQQNSQPQQQQIQQLSQQVLPREQSFAQYQPQHQSLSPNIQSYSQNINQQQQVLPIQQQKQVYPQVQYIQQPIQVVPNQQLYQSQQLPIQQQRIQLQPTPVLQQSYSNAQQMPLQPLQYVQFPQIQQQQVPQQIQQVQPQYQQQYMIGPQHQSQQGNSQYTEQLKLSTAGNHSTYTQQNSSLQQSQPLNGTKNQNQTNQISKKTTSPTKITIQSIPVTILNPSQQFSSMPQSNDSQQPLKYAEAINQDSIKQFQLNSGTSQQLQYSRNQYNVPTIPLTVIGTSPRFEDAKVFIDFEQIEKQQQYEHEKFLDISKEYTDIAQQRRLLDASMAQVDFQTQQLEKQKNKMKDALHTLQAQGVPIDVTIEQLEI